MAITEQEREKRKKFVGSSDIAAIIGVDPHRNAGDVWLSKTNRLRPTETTTEMRRGIALEPYVLSMFEAEVGVDLARDVWVQGDDVCAANLDGAISDDATIEHGASISVGDFRPILTPVEAKTSNFGSAWNADTGDVPLIVLVQAMFQILCVGSQCGHAFTPALVPDFNRFRFVSPVPIVKRNDEFLEELRIAAHEFWEYVRKDERPPDAVPHLESLKRMKREPNMVLSLGDEAAALWGKYEALGVRAKGIERDLEEYKQQILATLGDAEGARLPDGRLITFMEQNSPRHCDIDRLQVLSPDLYSQLVTQGKHRVLRIKKAAVGKKR